ncbi:hypothetical protein [Pararhodospirillum photometricum]|nr:hypothetical protein [Pararhodospirillum photometricum]
MTDITVLTPSDDDGGVPPYRVDLQYLRCWRTQDEPAAGVTSDRKAFLSKEYRTKTALNGAIKTKHLLSPVMTRTTLLVVPEDAQAEAERLLALYGVRRDYVRVTVRFGQGDFGLFGAIDIGQTVNVRTTRLGYSAGRNLIVLGIVAYAHRQVLVLDLWG